MRIIWANKGDSGVCFPIKHGKLNTRLFVLPSEILLNERKRNRGRKVRKEGGRENEGGRRRIDNSGQRRQHIFGGQKADGIVQES